MNERCVIVFNRTGPIPLRHIVTLKHDNEEYNEESFKAWYYSVYREIEGDEFLYCATRKERDEALAKINTM